MVTRQSDNGRATEAEDAISKVAVSEYLASALTEPSLGGARAMRFIARPTTPNFVDKHFGSLTFGFASDEPPKSKHRTPLAADQRAALPSEPVYKDTRATMEEMAALKVVATPEQIQKVKEEINFFGRDPRDAVLEAAKEKRNRVIGFGESHMSPNGMRTLAETMMGDFKKAGFTHLAVEIHQDHQDLLDKSARRDYSANFKLLQLYGGVHMDELRIFSAAFAAGIKLVAVDGNYTFEDAIANGGKSNISAEDRLRARDKFISAKVTELLAENPEHKVLLYIGARHLEVESNAYVSAAEQIRATGKKQGYEMVTFGAEMEKEKTNYFTTPLLAKNASRAVSIETNKTEALKSFPATQKVADHDTLGHFDHTIFMPQDTALKLVQEKYGDKDYRTVPALQDLVDFRFGRDDHPAALSVLDQAVDIAKACKGPGGSDLADHCQALASVSKNGEIAAKYSAKSLEIIESVFGKSDPEYAFAIADAIRTCLKKDNLTQAAKFAELAADFKPKLGDHIRLHVFFDATTALASRLMQNSQGEKAELVMEIQWAVANKSGAPLDISLNSYEQLLRAQRLGRSRSVH